MYIYAELTNLRKDGVLVSEKSAMRLRVGDQAPVNLASLLNFILPDEISFESVRTITEDQYIKDYTEDDYKTVAVVGSENELLSAFDDYLKGKNDE